MKMQILALGDKGLAVLSSCLLAFFVMVSASALAQSPSGYPDTDGNSDVAPAFIPEGAIAAHPAVGSFHVSDGPYWQEDVPTYTCLETCSMLFGGAPDDYECSTQADSVDHLAWASGFGSNQHCNLGGPYGGGGVPIAEDFKQGTHTNCNEGFECYISTYVGDWCGTTPGSGTSVNYCYNISGLAYFHVTKTFSDGNDVEVDVKLTCNTGLPLQQTFTIAGGDPTA